MNARGIG